jgi:hypothetical protein
MRNVIGMLSICLLCSCALLKRKVAVEKQTAKSSLRLAETEKMKKVVHYSKTDSSYMETSIEVYPKGKFSYSLNKGFEGEASRILVSEKTAKVVHERKERQIDAKRELGVSQQAKQEHATKQTEVSRILFWWMVIIALGAMLVYAYHKLKFKLFNY